jgi:hypothetical protein
LNALSPADPAPGRGVADAGGPASSERHSTTPTSDLAPERSAGQQFTRRVVEEELTIEGAEAEASARDRKEENVRDTIISISTDILDLGSYAVPDFAKDLMARL